LRAAVAHEAARYELRDEKLAVFVERTRARMRAGLDEIARGKGGLTALPFATYAGFFMRNTNEMSREWRFQTDALVADACGSDALAEALRTTTGLPGALEAFARAWDSPTAPEFVEFAAFASGQAGSRAMAYARFMESDRAASQGTAPTLDARLTRLRQIGHGADAATATRVIEQFDLLDWRLTADGFARMRMKP
jgi:hypothetical protein